MKTTKIPRARLKFRAYETALFRSNMASGSRRHPVPTASQRGSEVGLLFLWEEKQFSPSPRSPYAFFTVGTSRGYSSKSAYSARRLSSEIILPSNLTRASFHPSDRRRFSRLARVSGYDTANAGTPHHSREAINRFKCHPAGTRRPGESSSSSVRLPAVARRSYDKRRTPGSRSLHSSVSLELRSPTSLLSSLARIG